MSPSTDAGIAAHAVQDDAVDVPRLPQKRYFRQRAHANPFADHDLVYPVSPAAMDWASHFPAFYGPQSDQCHQTQYHQVEFADIGCGYGGLLIGLAPMYPQTLMLGMEIRIKVCDFVRRRIATLREQHKGQYGNASVIRMNAMKFLPNFFRKAQLSKMFFLFPDPHFKRRKHKARIISPTLLSEYAYVLRPGGLVYTISDVHDLHLWMTHHLDTHPLFRRVPDADLIDDPVLKQVTESTEEGKKVRRNSGEMYPAVYERIEA